MKNKLLPAVLGGAFLFLLFFNGIIRHDVDAEEYYKLAAQKQFDCVADIQTAEGSAASGVLVADRYVLTAAHIAITSETREKKMQLQDGREVIIYESFNHKVTDPTGITIVVNGQRIAPKRFILYPDYLADPGKSKMDIMLIELEQPVKNVKPAKLNSAFDERSANIVGVGYGVTGIADKPETVARNGRKTAGENVIDSIGGQKLGEHHTRLLCDFDHPTRTDCNRMGSATPRPLEYICGGGDSGGGLFRQKGKDWELVGICKGGSYFMERFAVTGYYGQEMEWMRVAVFYDWIKETIK